MIRQGLAGVLGVAAAFMVMVDISAQTARQTGERVPKPQPTSEPAQPAGQPAGTALGSVRIGQNVRANGESLSAGTYSVRLVSDAVPGKVGQTPEFSRWVEFLQGGKVRGKELCTVLSSSEISKVVKDAPPRSGGSKVELLKGNDYIRVWFNRGGVHYLVHLAASGE